MSKKKRLLKRLTSEAASTVFSVTNFSYFVKNGYGNGNKGEKTEVGRIKLEKVL